MMPNAGTGPAAVLNRLAAATNGHDLEGLVACFADDYENATPVHPTRGFVGRDQVRRNWEQIFAAVPDLTVSVLTSVVDHHEVWSEWDMRGTRADGSIHHLAGVIVFEVPDDRIAAARFYLEPVDPDRTDVDAAVRAQVVR